MSTSAWADPAVQVGPRAGVELRDGADATAGVELRLAFARSPLIINPAFEYAFDSKLTLYRVSVTALYLLPSPIERVEPYAGVGVTATSFANKQMGPVGGDDNGNRMGMVLVAGSSLVLPVMSPFVQGAKGFGELSAVSILGGISIALAPPRVAAAAEAEPASFVGTAYLDNDVAGDVQSGRLGLGLSAAYFVRDWIGLELDGELHGHFFRDQDVAQLQPAGVDLNTSAELASANAIVPLCFATPETGSWCPYATAGIGATHATFDGTPKMPGATGVALAQTTFLASGGIGVIHQLTRSIGFRVDARYLHSFGGDYVRDAGWLRMSAGITVSVGR